MNHWMKFVFKIALVFALAISPLGAFAQTVGECGGNARAYLDAKDDIVSVMEAAEELHRKFASRAQINAIDNDEDRLFVQSVLDHIDRARRADTLSAAELDDLVNQTLTTAAATQVGGLACATQTATHTATSAESAECSCVQKCWNEYKRNISGDCNFWCRFGYALLLEACIADCLLPG